MATTMTNGGPNVEGNPTIGMSGTGNKQQSKAAVTSNKAVDTGRKQAGNPSDGAQR